MATRDPALTLRNKQIRALTEQIDELLDDVIRLTGYEKEQSLNAKYGGKHAEYIDIRNAVIESPEQFHALYLQGFLRTLEELGDRAEPGHNYYDAFLHLKKHAKVREWLRLFLTRTYLRNYDSLSKARPTVCW